jgi:circadian clock protein KaiB
MSKRARSDEAMSVVLYIAGDSPNSATARANLRAVITRHPERQVNLKIVDVLKDPERALRDRVLVTPTMIKATPPPERRVVGNLSNEAALLAALGVQASLDE